MTHTIIHSVTAVAGELTVCLCPQVGRTALHLAAREGKVNVVRLLTEAQAQINIQTVVHTLYHVYRLVYYSISLTTEV